MIDRYIVCEVFLANLRLARGDVSGAAAVLAQAEQSARQRNFVQRLPEVAAAQVLTLLHKGDVELAAQLVQAYDLPLSQARVYLAQGNPLSALQVLEPFGQQVEARGWQDERLRVMALLAVAHHANSETDRGLLVLGDALSLAEPGGFIRLFVDEGRPMAELLSEAAASGIRPDYVKRLLAAFETEQQRRRGEADQPLVEALSERELEILRLIAEGLSNQEIGERLFLALNTVKGYNQSIYAKLEVRRRTEAVARARELGLL